MSGVVRLKDGVSLFGLQPAGIRILATIDNCARVLTLDLTVTCGTDSHPASDVHTKGNALDLRVVNFEPAVLVKVYTFLVQTLGPAFTVLYETTTETTDPLFVKLTRLVNPKASAPHLHIQLLRNITWPPDRMIA